MNSQHKQSGLAIVKDRRKSRRDRPLGRGRGGLSPIREEMPLTNNDYDAARKRKALDRASLAARDAVLLAQVWPQQENARIWVLEARRENGLSLCPESVPRLQLS